MVEATERKTADHLGLQDPVLGRSFSLTLGQGYLRRRRSGSWGYVVINLIRHFPWVVGMGVAKSIYLCLGFDVTCGVSSQGVLFWGSELERGKSGRGQL